VGQIFSLAEHTLNGFHCWLTIRRKCLKVEYLGRIKYDFKKSYKSHVTGAWDHKVSVSAKKYKLNYHACIPFSNYHFQKNVNKLFLMIVLSKKQHLVLSL
jgi:hypothetical protein